MCRYNPTNWHIAFRLMHPTRYEATLFDESNDSTAMELSRSFGNQRPHSRIMETETKMRLGTTDLIVAALCSGVLASCATGPREMIRIEGRVILTNQRPIPKEYALVLLEERSQGLLVGTAYVAIAKIIPKQDGAFLFEGPVCKNLNLLTLVGDNVTASREATVWQSPIMFEFNDVQSQETTKIGSKQLFASELERVAELTTEYGGIENVPC